MPSDSPDVWDASNPYVHPMDRGFKTSASRVHGILAAKRRHLLATGRETLPSGCPTEETSMQSLAHQAVTSVTSAGPQSNHFKGLSGTLGPFSPGPAIAIVQVRVASAGPSLTSCVQTGLARFANTGQWFCWQSLVSAPRLHHKRSRSRCCVPTL